MMHFIFHPIFLIIYLYVVISTLYLLIFALAGRWAKNIQFEIVPAKKKIIVLIPAYKEDAIIVDTAKKAAQHNYPSTAFQILVIADSLKNETIEQLNNIPVHVLQVQFETSTKARSLYAALTLVKNDDFEIAVILDADNVMEADCLEQINSAFHNNIKAIQCHRFAKNQDTPVARLDAISEEININMFRRGPASLGLSAMPLGSGMAFEFELLKSIFETPGIVDNPAEDREIEIQLMKRNIHMEFLNTVIVYDEKVNDTRVFQKQRTRWLEAQLNHVYRFFKPDLTATSKTGAYFHILFQSLLLPRLLYLMISGLLILMLIVQWSFNVHFLYPEPIYWVTWMAAYFLSIAVSIPSRYYSIKTMQAIFYIPLLMVSMLKAIVKLKRNRTEFLHTSKTYNDK